MPTYEVTDSKTGRKVRLTGDSPPTDAELEQIFASPPGTVASPQVVQPNASLSVRAALALSKPGAPELGGTEAALSMATGLASMVPAGFAGLAGTVLPGPPGQGSRWVGNAQRALTYQPRSEAGKVSTELLSKPMELLDSGLTDYSAPNPAPAFAPPPGYHPMGEAAAADEERYLAAQNQNPLKSTAMKTGITAASMLLGPRGAPLDAAAPTAGRSAGAAAAATDLTAVSPELRAAVTTAGRKGAVSNEAITRHVEAESLPVPIRLTAGEATQDPIAISRERNLRGSPKGEGMVRRMEQTNKALGQNLSVMREQVGPEVFSTNAVEHGDTLIAAYRAKDSAAQAQIRAKYKALRDANGGSFPIDAKLLLDNAVDALHKELLFDDAPKSVLAALGRLGKKGSMTFENFESLRTNLARIQRSQSADGNVKYAAGIIRQAMEELPMRTVESGENLLATEGAGSAAAQKLINQQYRFTKLKKLADDARTAARAQFQAIEADPAYEAAIKGTTSPDAFVKKFVINAPRDQVETLLKNLGDNSKVRQTVSVSVLDHLRDAARLTPSYEGNFSAAGYNRALQTLSPKANILFDAATADNLGKLGNVSRYTTAQPRGSFVNNSNTLVASLSKPVLATGEGALNYAAMGVPVGTAARNLLERATIGREINKALKPGAGIAQKKRGITKKTAQEELLDRYLDR